LDQRLLLPRGKRIEQPPPLLSDRAEDWSARGSIRRRARALGMAGADRGEEAALEQGLLAPEVSLLDHLDHVLVFSDDEWRLSICMEHIFVRFLIYFMDNKKNRTLAHRIWNNLSGTS